MLNLLGGEDGINDAGISVVAPHPDARPRSSSRRPRSSSAARRRTSSRRTPATTSSRSSTSRRTRTSPSRRTSSSAARGRAGTTSRGRASTRRSTGVDATFRWKPLRQGLYRSLLVRGEWMLSERETPAGTTVRADGWYAPRAVPARAALVRRLPARRVRPRGRRGAPRPRRLGDPHLLAVGVLADPRAAPAQPLRRSRPAPSTATELLVQLQFVIGAHGAHPF